VADAAWKAHERAVGAAFSRWIAQTPPKGKAPEIISRQALHGRMVERLWGDLAIHPKCPDAWLPAAAWFMGRFQVDAKRRKVFSLPAWLSSPKHAVWGWWDKLTDETASDKFRMMILMDRKSRILVYGEREAKWIEEQQGKSDHTLFRTRSPERETLAVCHFETALRWLDPSAYDCPKPKKLKSKRGA
jgi:hypothetical protein